MPFLPPNQQRQSTEGIRHMIINRTLYLSVIDIIQGADSKLTLGQTSFSVNLGNYFFYDNDCLLEQVAICMAFWCL